MVLNEHHPNFFTNRLSSAPHTASTSLLSTIAPFRFRFFDPADLLLLKSVSAAGAHLAPWGQKGTLFEDAHKRFLAAAPATLINGREKPSQKTIVDRFKTLVAKRRDSNKENAAASGIVEDLGEREMLLDDFILEIDEKAEKDRAEKKERTQNEKKPGQAGENIRNAALRRQPGRDAEDSQGHNSRKGSSRQSPPASGRASRVANATYVCDSDEDDSNLLKEEFSKRRETEKWRLEIDEKRFCLEEKSLRLDEMRYHESQEATKRRLDLDEKKAAVEMEERKQAITERSKMIDVLSALASRLQ